MVKSGNCLVQLQPASASASPCCGIPYLEYLTRYCFIYELYTKIFWLWLNQRYLHFSGSASARFWLLLPPAYVVRREGTVFTGVCLSTGGGRGTQVWVPPLGVRVPPRGGVPKSRYPPGGVPKSGYPPQGGTQVRVPPGGVPKSGYPPGGSGYPPGGVPKSGDPPGGYRSPPTPPRGVPRSGYPPRGGTEVRVPPGGLGIPPWGGGTEVRVPPLGGYRSPGTPPGGVPKSRDPPRGVPKSPYPPGGVLKSGYPPRGVPRSGYPPWGGTRVRVPPRGGTRVRYPPLGGYLTRVGQQKEYSLHGGRYASCVHAGGLSCLYCFHVCFSNALNLTKTIINYYCWQLE